MADPYGFAPGDPPITMSRSLAVGLLERMEMARDSVEHRVGKRDEHGRWLIAELTALLSRLPEQPPDASWVTFENIGP